jgi:hypothetical protein
MENWTEGPWEVQTYQEPFDAGKTCLKMKKRSEGGER